MNESRNESPLSTLPVWDYPMSEKYSDMYRLMRLANPPATTAEGIARVLNSSRPFAFISAHWPIP